MPRITNQMPVVGGFKNYLGTGNPMTAFGNFYSFPLELYPDDWFYASTVYTGIEFQHDVALFGELNESKLKLTFNGQVYPFTNAGQKFVGQQGCDAIVYRALVPNIHRLPAGNYTGLIEITDKATPANTTRHYIQINVVNPPDWIRSDKFKVRKIGVPGLYSPPVLSFTASQYPAGDTSSISNLDTDVPKVGFLKNRVSNQDEVRQYIYPDKNTGILYDGYFGATVLDESTGKKTNTTVAGGSQITFGPNTETVLDTGKIPLYRYVFGFPPIAGATLGADMWFDATLTYDGLVKFIPGGGASTTLTVTPDATIGVDAFLDAELLFGLASAEAHAKPDIGLKMPTTFTDGILTDTDKCFHYKLDIKWEVSAGVWPFEWSEGDTETIFNDTNPKPCPTSPGAPPAGTISLPSAETPSPPAASPAMAVDGFGHTLLVWVKDGNIWYRPFSGGQAGLDKQVTTTFASSDPQVAYYAPNKAVAVWTESSLTGQLSQTAGLNERIDAQYLRYALWNGTIWTPPASLTQPGDSGGEGKVVLAGCLSTKTGCPAAGEVTAVWVRNTASGGDISARQFRIYSASFNGAVWTTSGPVDPNNTSADTEPDVAYLNSGIPVAAWVRDADSSLSNSSSRRIAYRMLVDGQPVVVDTSLPTGVVEPSLAINAQDELLLAFTVAVDPLALVGNQRQLYAAKRSCPNTCGWTYQALVDPNGRPVHAENPRLTINSNGQAQVTYRALGFGAASPGGPVVLKGDALGTILGTGEIAQAFVDFNSSSIAPSYLTNAGSTIWQVSAVFDPLFNQVYTAGSLGSSPALGVQARATLEAAGYQLDTTQAAGPVVFSAASSSLDLAVTDVSLSTLNLSASGELNAFVSIVNNGAATRTNADVVLTWDGPVGVGTLAGQASIPVSSNGALTVVEFSAPGNPVVIPEFPHLPHVLYVQVNPSQSLPESDFTNNITRIFLGGLPVPQGLEGSARAGDSSVFLRWQAVDHPAVKGYRIYRSSDERNWEPVGSAFGTGFVDLSAVQGKNYWYAVVAYAEDGFESPFSNRVAAEVRILTPVYLPLVIR